MYICGAKNAVDTGDTYFTELGGSHKHKFVDARNILQGKVISNIILDARVEYARWIVDCPNCHNAEFVFEDKLFYCSMCKNSNIQGQVYRVNIPTKRKEIEYILGKRNIINRHWNPNETVKQLQEENISHGIEVM